MSDIFVSYRTSDDPFAAVAIDEKLCERFGADRIFRGNRAIPPGVNFAPELWGALGRCTLLAAVIGPRWLAARPDGTRHVDSPDDFVRQEIAFAMKIGIRVVPILVGDAGQPTAEQLPEDIRPLASHQYLRVNPGTFEQDMRHVLDTFAAILNEDGGRGRAVAGPCTVMAIQAQPGSGPDDTVAAIRRVLRASVDDAGLRADDLLERTRGRTVMAISKSLAPAALISDLVPALKAQLDRGMPLRLRVTVDAGEVAEHGDALAGDAVERAVRLLRADSFNAIFSASPSARLVLAVSNECYRTAVVPAYDRLDASTFQQFRIAGQATDATGWAHVPGSSAPPGLPLLRPTPKAVTPRSSRRPRKTSSIINNGNVWVQGDQVAGDKVMGDKVHERVDGRVDEADGRPDLGAR